MRGTGEPIKSKYHLIVRLLEEGVTEASAVDTAETLFDGDERDVTFDSQITDIKRVAAKARKAQQTHERFASEYGKKIEALRLVPFYLMNLSYDDSVAIIDDIPELAEA